jgi:hypothetical protein
MELSEEVKKILEENDCECAHHSNLYIPSGDFVWVRRKLPHFSGIMDIILEENGCHFNLMHKGTGVMAFKTPIYIILRGK